MTTRFLAIVALLTALSANGACSTAPPIVQPLTTCGGHLVTADNLKRVENDLGNLSGGGEADLLAWIETDGPSLVACLVEWYIQNGTSTERAAASRFKTGHKAQLTPAQASSFKGSGDITAACIGAWPTEAPAAWSASPAEPGADDPGTILAGICVGCGHIDPTPPGKGPGLAKGGGA